MNVGEPPASLPDGASSQFLDLADVRLHYVTAGSGDRTLVLLHGWPQTWYCWRRLVPLLDDHRLVMPDLRGLGDSGQPTTGFDKGTVATDVQTLLAHLGVTRAVVVGHDWGAVVGYRLACAAPAVVEGLAILDAQIPGATTADAADPRLDQGGRRWHLAFHQTPELPESLLSGREEIYLRWFYQTFGDHPDVLSDDEIAEYLRTYRRPEVFRAGLAYYRSIDRDALDTRTELATAGKLRTPVLALGGGTGWGRGTEPLEAARAVAHDVTGGLVAACGHWLPEEQPAELARHLRDLLARTGA